MATKTRIVGWNPKAVLKEMTDNAIALQTERLVEYAKKTIIELGNKIQTYNSNNNLDRTGNLLNSLCWGVSYNGKLESYGFYREETLKAAYINQWKGKSTTSYLHEWIPEYESYPVDGRKFAESYIKRYGKAGSANSWRVFFAILAPYWGYWEEGFSSKRFSVSGLHIMSQLYDKVSKELQPAKVDFKMTKDINYVKSYRIKSIKRKSAQYVRGTIERHYDNWMKRQK